MPHLGQALCGSLRSWQLGHSEVVMPVSASCERRLEVRALEWRRFGFGIADSFQAFSQSAGPAVPGMPETAAAWDRFSTLRFHPAAEIGQRCPPRIALASFASTGLGIPIPSTARAKSFTVLLAERSRGQG